MPDVLFILLLALVIFGPRKLPELASQVGKYLAQFREMKREFADQIQSEIRKLEGAENPRTAVGPPIASKAQQVTEKSA
jgi:sec-independent protein translocase protein TatB